VHSAQQIVFREAIDAIGDADQRWHRLEQQLAVIVTSWSMAPVMEAYQAMRGASFIVAVTFAAEIGDVLTYSASLCAASVKVLPESATPDVQCVFALASHKPGLIRRFDDRPGITGGPWQMRPLSRGYILVRSPDPRD
jgi:hypothetical protein